MQSFSSANSLIKNRFLGFLIWQSIPSTILFFLFKSFLSTSLTSKTSLLHTFLPSFKTIISFFMFHISQLLFSSTLAIIASPLYEKPASLFEILSGIVRVLYGGSLVGDDFFGRVKVFLRFLLFVLTSGVSGFIAVLAFCGVRVVSEVDGGVWVVVRLGLRGFLVGLLFGLHFVFMRRWVLEFPIVQRLPYFSFKMGLPSAVRRALRLSCVASIFSAILIEFIPHPYKSSFTMRRFFIEHIIFSIGSFAVFICWEFTHHLHQVLHTKRFMFAPPKGSAAAETNPSEYLLVALEESHPTSLLRYLAYLDLSMVCEKNVDTWRRAAFFEETGETYKRVIAVCLRPLEQLASRLGEGLGNSVDKPAQLSNQLLSPTDSPLDMKCIEQLSNFKLYAWCSKTVASMTACSHKEDKFGIAQLSGSNAAVVSTLISCLLAVEAFMGKKTNLQSPNQLLGPANIRWLPANSGRADVATVKRRTGPVNSKAYAIADVLKTSIYQIVSTFHDEMLASAKAGLLEKDWIISGKPIFGTHEILVQKLRLFLDFRAT